MPTFCWPLPLAMRLIGIILVQTIHNSLLWELNHLCLFVMPGYCVVFHNNEGKSKQSRHHTWHLSKAYRACPTFVVISKDWARVATKINKTSHEVIQMSKENVSIEISLFWFMWKCSWRPPCILVSGQPCHMEGILTLLEHRQGGGYDCDCRHYDILVVLLIHNGAIMLQVQYAHLHMS